MRVLLTIVAAAMLAIGVSPAGAQTTFPTRSAGVRVPATVPLQCDASGQNCAPASAGNPPPAPAGVATAANQSTQITAEQAIQANQTNGSQRARVTLYSSDMSVPISTSYLTSDLIDPRNVVANAQQSFNYDYDPSSGGFRPVRGDLTGWWVHGPTSTPTAQGGIIAASGGTLPVAFVAASDTEIHNPGTATLWGSWGTPTVNGAGSYSIAPGATYRPPNRPVGTFTLLATAANSPVTVTRF